MTTHFKKTITPDEIVRNGQTVTINRVTNAIRDHLQMLFGPIGPVQSVHVEITSTPLTDAGGEPLMTRGDDDD